MSEAKMINLFITQWVRDKPLVSTVINEYIVFSF